MPKRRKRKYNKRQLTAFSQQEGGDHYTNMSPQPMEFILGNDIHYTEGRVIEYMARWRVKGGVSDLKKARHLLDLLIEHRSK